MSFELWLDDKVKIVEKALRDNLIRRQGREEQIYDAMEYSLFTGGKRLRPVIMLGVNEIFNSNYQTVLPFACALEMIHTYSLIHDDLPAMDDDDYRRGKLSNHKKFGEALAILAGDGLLNMAFELMLRESLSSHEDKSLLLKAMNIIAESSGSRGMIAGQVVDMFGQDNSNDIKALEYLHKHKTGAIIKSSAIVGGLLGGASEGELKNIEIFADNIGLAFQIQDDILDVEGNEQKLGKPIGSDKDNNKMTYVSILGLNESKKLQEKLTNEAIEALKTFGDKSNMLVELCKYLLVREN